MLSKCYDYQLFNASDVVLSLKLILLILHFSFREEIAKFLTEYAKAPSALDPEHVKCQSIISS